MIAFDKKILKQTPVKAKVSRNLDKNDNPIVYYSCPRCNLMLDKNDAKCDKCGQVITWK